MNLLVVEVVKDDISMDASPYVGIINFSFLEVSGESHVKSKVDWSLNLIQLESKVPISPQLEWVAYHASHLNFLWFVCLECDIKSWLESFLHIFNDVFSGSLRLNINSVELAIDHVLHIKVALFIDTRVEKLIKPDESMSEWKSVRHSMLRILWCHEVIRWYNVSLLRVVHTRVVLGVHVSLPEVLQ